MKSEEYKRKQGVSPVTFKWSPNQQPMAADLDALPKLPSKGTSQNALAETDVPKDTLESPSQQANDVEGGKIESPSETVRTSATPNTTSITTTPKWDVPAGEFPVDETIMSPDHEQDLEPLVQPDENLRVSPESSDSLDEFDDDVLFPGFHFDDENQNQKSVYAIHDSWDNLAQDEHGHTRNPLDTMDELTREEEKKRIMKKYYKHGTLSTFKGRAEMKAFKAKLEAKNVIQRVLEDVASKEAELERIENMLVETRENKSQSLSDMKKIIEEIQKIVEQTFPAGACKHIVKALEDHHHHSLPSSQSLPTEPQLMTNKRYRMLRDQYKQHETYVSKSTTLIPELQSTIVQIRRELPELHAKEWELRPLQRKIAESDLQEFAELQIVAQERAILAEKKARILQRHVEKIQREHEQKKQASEMEAKQKEADWAERNARIQERYQSTIEKIRNHKEKSIQKLQNQNLRKVNQLAKLSEHIERERIKAHQKSFSQPEHVQVRPLEDIPKSSTEEKSVQILMKLVKEEHKRSEAEKRVQSNDVPKLVEHITRPNGKDDSLREKVPVQPRDINSHESLNFSLKTVSQTRRLPETEESLVTDNLDRIHNQSGDFEKQNESPSNEISGLEDFMPHPRRHLPPPQMKNYKPHNMKITELPHGTCPFLAAPCQFMFEDYEPEQSYIQKAIVTNISGRINSFRLLPIPIEISSFFDILFSPPGKLSAGRGVEIKVVFRAPVGFQQDIPLTAIQFEADIGDQFCIHVGCQTKKCIPKIASAGGEKVKGIRFHQKTKYHTQEARDMDVYRLLGSMPNSKAKPAALKLSDSHYELDFGSLYVGGRKSLYLDLCNMGAMPVEFQVEAGPAEPTDTELSHSQDLSFFSARSSSNLLKNYDSQLVYFDFHPPFFTKPKPEFDGKHPSKDKHFSGGSVVNSDFWIKFGENDITPIRISCKALVIESPIFLDRDVLDFKICVVDTMYQDKFVIRNHHTIALKFWIECEDGKGETRPIDEEFVDGRLGHVKVSPPIAFVQPFEPFQVWITIQPSLSALEKAGSKFCIPLFLKYIEDGTGITRSIPFHLSGMITKNQIVLKGQDGSDTLKFEYCSTQEIKELPVIITNDSLLPQTVRFIRTSPALSLLPLDGTITPEVIIFLQPLQSLTYLARFEPSQQGPFSMSLICQNTFSKTFEILCTGFGVLPLARFDNSRLSFSSCSFGSQANMRVNICRDQVNKAIKQKVFGGSEFGQNEIEYLDNVIFEFGSPIVLSLLETMTSHSESNVDLRSDQIQTNTKNSNVSAKHPHPGQIEIFNHVLTNQDPPLVQTFPRVGTLRPGESTSVEVIVCPPVKTSKPHISSEIQTTSLDKDDVALLPQTDFLPKPKGNVATTKSTVKSNRKDSVFNKNLSTTSTVAANLSSLASSTTSVAAASMMKLPTDLPVTLENAEEAPSPIVIEQPRTFADKLATYDAPLVNILLPCHLKISVSEDRRLRALIEGKPVTDSEAPFTDPNSSKHESDEFHLSEKVVYLDLLIPVVPIDVILVEPDEKRKDFGQVPIGERVLKTILIKNTTKQDLNMEVEGLNPFGPFFLAKAIRPIPAMEKSTIILSFEPDAVLKFSSTLELKTETTKIQIKLVGEGVSPSVTIEPSSKSLFLGDVCVTESATKPFKIVNESIIPVTCALNFAKEYDLKQCFCQSGSPSGTENFYDTPVFSISHYRVTIPPLSSYDVTVRFSPTRESDNFFDHIVVTYWGQKTPCVVHIAGRGWEHTPVILGYEPHPVSYIESKWISPPPQEVERAYRKLTDDESREPISEELFRANDDLMAKVIRVAPHRDVRFATVSIPWQKRISNAGTDWVLEPTEITLANMKPPNAKVDTGKKSPTVEFSIEPFEGSFAFSQVFDEYVICNQYDIVLYGVLIKFDIDASKGSIEYGATRSIKLTPRNTAQRFWNDMTQTWSKYGVPLDSSALETNAVYDKPHYAEAVFKVTLRGGVRLVDPKGVIPQQEPRVWFLKVRTSNMPT